MTKVLFVLYLGAIRTGHRVDELQVNINNPQCCHVRCKMKPSMKVGVYNTYMLLWCEGDLACIKLATYECGAGYV